MLVVGSPTHGGFPSPEIDSLLRKLPALEGFRVASFDTRAKTTIFGYAAPKIAKRLEEKGGNLARPPEGFFYFGDEGSASRGRTGADSAMD